MIRKLITISLFSIVFFIAAIFVAWNAAYTIASDEKHDEFSDVTFGYTIEKYYCCNSIRLTFWNKRGLFNQMNTSYNLSQLTVDNVVEQRWLKNDQAIYLNLQIKYHDSAVSIHPARIIYDFHRGEIHTSSEFTLWRNWNTREDIKGWMTETEFNDILERLSLE